MASQEDPSLRPLQGLLSPPPTSASPAQLTPRQGHSTEQAALRQSLLSAPRDASKGVFSLLGRDQACRASGSQESHPCEQTTASSVLTSVYPVHPVVCRAHVCHCSCLGSLHLSEKVCICQHV